MTLHDWIDELCDALDVDVELDEGLVLDLARDVAHGVERAAAPVTGFLLGYAAAVHGASPQKVEELAGRASDLAERWGRADDDDEDSAAEDDAEVDLVDAD